MSRPKLLNEDQISRELKDIPKWKREDSKINREFVCENFAKVIGIVNSIAILAEKAEHHPDLNIYGWNKLNVSLSTHDVGGLTELDFKLANKIDELVY